MQYSTNNKSLILLMPCCQGTHVLISLVNSQNRVKRSPNRINDDILTNPDPTPHPNPNPADSSHSLIHKPKFSNADLTLTPTLLTLTLTLTLHLSYLDIHQG